MRKPAFTVTGIVTATSLGSDGTAGTITATAFDLSRRGHKWYAVSTTKLQKSISGAKPAQTTTWTACDGTNVFILDATGPRLASGRTFHQSGLLLPGQVPMYGYVGATVWLTFCSSGLISPHEKRFRPLYEGYQATQSVRVKVWIEPGMPGLIRRMEFYSNYPGQTNEFTNAVFTTSAFIEFHKQFLPKRSSLTVYSLAGSRVVPSEKEVLRVNAFSDVARNRFVPDLGGRATWIEDDRFADGHDPSWAFQYVSKRWLPVKEVQSMKGFAAYKRHVSRREAALNALKESQRFHRPLFVALLIAIFLSPVGFLMWRRHHLRRKI